MSKIKLFLVLTFVLVCAAGVGVGMIVDQRLRPVIAPPDHHPHGPMDELKLTPDQQDKMRTIWSEVGKLRDQRFKDRRDLSQKRDAQIVALLTPSQKADYGKIQDAYRASVKESEDSLQEAVHKAEDQTRSMLTPEQLPIYEKIRSRIGPPGSGRGRGGRNRNRSTTQPATMPANTATASTVG